MLIIFCKTIFKERIVIITSKANNSNCKFKMAKHSLIGRNVGFLFNEINYYNKKLHFFCINCFFWSYFDFQLICQRIPLHKVTLWQPCDKHSIAFPFIKLHPPKTPKESREEEEWGGGGRIHNEFGGKRRLSSL